jgi:hypothetical protein
VSWLGLVYCRWPVACSDPSVPDTRGPAAGFWFAPFVWSASALIPLVVVLLRADDQPRSLSGNSIRRPSDVRP